MGLLRRKCGLTYFLNTKTRNLEETEKPFYNTTLHVQFNANEQFIQVRRMQALGSPKSNVKREILMSTITDDRPEYLKMKDTQPQPLVMPLRV